MKQTAMAAMIQKKALLFNVAILEDRGVAVKKINAQNITKYR
ncbi:hypothetical protein [uncultured Microscilla sp.]|nr:hypothetical protein [uncultured Microscilla sp.]